jgi:1,2-diacylglycerol 3-beta-glucosyltransferase
MSCSMLRLPLAILRPRTRLKSVRGLVLACAALESVLALSASYLLALLLAAWRGNALEPPTNEVGQLDLTVLVPAHDEEAGISATLRSLQACDYPTRARRIIVVADNCSDLTASCALVRGVEVWERVDAGRRGKGFALAWALERLRTERSFDAVVMLDADCEPSPNMLAAIEARIHAGASAVQVNYISSNPGASSASALRFAGLALMNTVRFRGKQRLGLSCGLVGSGMAFTRELLEREPWTATGLTEDGEYHMRLVKAGVSVGFVSEAYVSSPMPTVHGSASEERWEQGKLQLIRRWSPRLISSGIARRDPVRLHAGLECLVPPQSLISAGSLASIALATLAGSRRLFALSLLTLLGQFAFVLGGLRLVRAPTHVYRALAVAPVLIVSKSLLYARLLRGRGPTSWVRAGREGSP